MNLPNRMALTAIGRFARLSGATALTGALALTFALTLAPGSAVAEECEIFFDTDGGATSVGTDTLACGDSSVVDGAGGTAIGSGTHAYIEAVAIGNEANADSVGSVAIGTFWSSA